MAHFTSSHEIEEWLRSVGSHAGLTSHQREAVHEVMMKHYRSGVGIPEYDLPKLLKDLRKLRDETHALGTSSHSAVEKALQEEFEGGTAAA